jgi:hypothetical protein
VGARLLSQGLDPYYYRWRPNNPETLRDPFDKLELPVSRVTVSPIGLAFYTPFANFPYRTQRLIWLVLQQLALFCSLVLLIFTTGSSRNKAILAISLIMINSNYSLRSHVETGQIYIFFVFLIAVSYWFLSQKNRFRYALSGLSLGLAIAIRPPLIVMALPMLLFQRIRLFGMALVGASIWLLVSVLQYGYPVWANYFSAMGVISKLSRGELKIPTQDLKLPQVLEGMKFGFIDANPSYETSLALKLHKTLGFHPSIGHLVALLAIILSGYLFIAFRLYRPRQNVPIPLRDVLLMLGGVMVLIVDFLMPIPRNSYNDVLYLVPLIPVLKYIRWNHYLDILVSCLLLFGLLHMGGLFIWIPIMRDRAGQWLTLAALVCMSLLILRNDDSAWNQHQGTWYRHPDSSSESAERFL